MFFLIPRSYFPFSLTIQTDNDINIFNQFHFNTVSLSYLTNDISNTNSRIKMDFTDQMNYLVNNPLEFRTIVFRSLKLFEIFISQAILGG